jgi:hypothetical protein
VNGDLRPSRLVKSNLNYVVRSLLTIVRIFVIYKPLRFFLLLSFLLAVPGFAAILRFLYLYASGNGGGNVQSLVIAATLIACAAVLCIGGLLADLIAANRALLEDLRTRQMRLEIEATRQRRTIDVDAIDELALQELTRQLRRAETSAARAS